jgi:hypothetical protein
VASREHKTALEARRKAALQRAEAIMAQLRTEGATSLRQIADGLNARGVPAPKGGRWSPVQVIRAQARMPPIGPRKMSQAFEGLSTEPATSSPISAGSGVVAS